MYNLNQLSFSSFLFLENRPYALFSFHTTVGGGCNVNSGLDGGARCHRSHDYVPAIVYFLTFQINSHATEAVITHP